METKETIPVYIKIVKGKTVCICYAGVKKCKEICSVEVVQRDRFRGWESTIRRDRFGR